MRLIFYLHHIVSCFPSCRVRGGGRAANTRTDKQGAGGGVGIPWPSSPPLCRGLGHGRDDALLHEHTRLGAVLEGLLGGPLGADGQAEGALVLLARLEGVGELRGEVPVVL